MKINVGVLFGGSSVEHDISIISALQVMNSLDKERYHIIPLYLNRDHLLLTGDKYQELSTYQENQLTFKKQELVNFLHLKNANYLVYPFKKCHKKLKIDLILPIMHGKGLEDGNIAGFLEILKLPYITSAPLGASICQDKVMTKLFLENIKVPIIEYEVLKSLKMEKSRLEYPLIIKPATLGSSIGISKVRNDSEYQEALIKAYQYDNKVLIEKCLENFKEYSVAVYQKNEQLIISDIEEIEILKDLYRFSDKYLNGEKVLEHNHQIPALIPDSDKRKIHEIAQKIYSQLELSGVVRIDYLLDKDTKILYVNEINTIPGSLAFYLFHKQGITFEVLLNDLIKEGLIKSAKTYVENFDSSILSYQTLKGKK